MSGGAGYLLLQAQQPPQFTALRHLANNETGLTLSATTGRSYRIEAATNAQDWDGLFTLFP